MIPSLSVSDFDTSQKSLEDKIVTQDSEEEPTGALDCTANAKALHAKATDLNVCFAIKNERRPSKYYLILLVPRSLSFLMAKHTFRSVALAWGLALPLSWLSLHST